MARKWIKKAVYISGVVIQLALIIGVFVLESLTTKKAGVMHHIYYRRAQYEQTVFSEKMIDAHIIALALVLIISLIFIIRAFKTGARVFHKVQAVLCALISVATLFVILRFEQKLSYHYFIIAFELSLAVQTLSMILSRETRKS